jgi:hypothetical protein
MATFGNISSASPNVLFDPMAVDRALQQRQQNALLMDMQREDQQFQRENQQFARANGGMTPYQAATLQQQKEALQAERDGVAGLWGNTAPVAPVAAPGAAPAAGPAGNLPPDIAARVLYGEAGNQGPQGLLAAAHVVLNRARLTGKSPEEVVTAPGQFEAYGNPASRARLMALKPEEYAAAQQAMQAATSGQAPDPTGGATHYLNPQLQAQMGRQQPGWATGEGTRIGAHVFYSRPGDFRQTAQTPAAARTGGTDMAGPGVAAAPGGMALDPPGTPEWARGTTAEDQARLRAMGGKGVKASDVVAEAGRMAERNRAQLRFEQQHPQQTGPAAPYSGTGIDAQDSNILLRGDPGSREYAAAYARQAAVIRRPDGSEIRPDMSPYEVPTFRSGSAPAGGAEAPARGRNYGVPEEVKSAPVTPAAREAVRKVETDVTRADEAIKNFLQVHKEVGGGGLSAYLNNPRSPQAQRLLGAFDSMKVALRNEAFLNTGVLQPAEAKMLDETLLSPQSLTGAFASNEGIAARLGEIQKTLQRNLSAARRSAGIDIQGPTPGSTAEPPPAAGSRPPLSSFAR